MEKTTTPEKKREYAQRIKGVGSIRTDYELAHDEKMGEFARYGRRVIIALDLRIESEKAAIETCEANIAMYKARYSPNSSFAKKRIEQAEARKITEKALLGQYEDIRRRFIEKCRFSLKGESEETIDVFISEFLEGGRTKEEVMEKDMITSAHYDSKAEEIKGTYYWLEI